MCIFVDRRGKKYSTRMACWGTARAGMMVADKLRTSAK